VDQRRRAGRGPAHATRAARQSGCTVRVPRATQRRSNPGWPVYFIHEAIRDDVRLHTYEFLHTTFGEYLIARLVARELEDLADAARIAASRTRPEPVDDGFLYALLSQMPLTKRGTIVSFAAERIQALTEHRRHQVLAVLLELFGNSLGPRQGSLHPDYSPVPVSVPARYAAYSANLVTLAVLAAGELTGSLLFPAARDPVGEWRNLTLLWRSQLPRDGWEGLVGTLGLDRVWHDDDKRDIAFRHEEAGPRAGNLDPHWSYGPLVLSELQPGRRLGWRHIQDNWLRDQAWFLCDNDDDTATHALEPLINDLDIVCTFHSYWPGQGRAMSTANALINLWLASSSDCPPDELARTYDTCMEIAIRARFGGYAPSKLRRFYRTLVFRQLAADRKRVLQSWLNAAMKRIKEAAGVPGEAYEQGDLLDIAKEFFPELIGTPRPSGNS
jgi:hypothetical protein